MTTRKGDNSARCVISPGAFAWPARRFLSDPVFQRGPWCDTSIESTLVTYIDKLQSFGGASNPQQRRVMTLKSRFGGRIHDHSLALAASETTTIPPPDGQNSIRQSPPGSTGCPVPIKLQIKQTRRPGAGKCPKRPGGLEERKPCPICWSARPVASANSERENRETHTEHVCGATVRPSSKMPHGTTRCLLEHLPRVGRWDAPEAGGVIGQHATITL